MRAITDSIASCTNEPENASTPAITAWVTIAAAGVW
jgi:hypothetical protein